MTLEKLQVIIQAQTKEYMEAMNKVQQQTAKTTNKVERYVGKIKSAFGKIGKVLGIALSVAAIVNFGKQCIELGSDLAEVQNVVDVTFGALNREVEEFAQNALEQFGLSELSAKQYTSTMGAMLKSMGFTTRAAADMSMELTGLAGDVASFYNLSGDEAFAKIRSGISGETEPLKQLGINLSVANLEQFALTQGMTKSYNAMNQQEQALLRYNYLLSVTSDAQGDFARTSDSWANQTKILTERFNSLKAAIGQGLINVFTPVLRVLNQVIAKLTEAAKAFQRFTEIITGKKSQTNNSMSGVATNTENATVAMGGLTSATNKAGGAAKKAEEAFHGLLGFDEINALAKAQDSSEGGSDTSGGGLDDMSGFVDDTAQETDQELNPVLQKLIDKLKELRDLFKEGFKAGLGDVTLEPLKNAIDGIKTSLKEIFTDPGVLAAADNWANTVAYSLGQITGAVASIGITIATNLFGGLNKYLEGNKDLIKQRLINMFDISAEIWTIQGNFAQAFANIFSAFGGENGQRVTAALIGIFANAWMGVNELCMKASRDVMDVITRPFIDNQAALKQALDDTLGVIATTLETIKGVVDETVSKASEVYDAHLKPMFDALATGLSSITATITAAYQTYILPVLDGLNEKFGTFVDQHLQPMINKFLELIGTIADGVTKIWNELLAPFFNWFIQNVAPIVAEKLDFIGSVLLTVLGVVADVIGGIFDALGGLIDFIVGVFTGDWQQAWDGIKAFFKGIWDAIYAIISTVWNAIYSVVSSVISAVSTVISSVLNVIKTVFSTIFTSIKTTVTTIFNAIRSTITMVLATIQTGISTALNTVKTIFSTVFTSIKTTVTTIFNSMWSTIKGVINSIIGGVEGMANAVVNGINTVIKAMNNLSFEIPDWVPDMGGKTFGFNIPTLSTVSLPRLAMGGVVDGATPLIAGEAGKEAIVPLEKNTGWMDQIANRLGEMIVGSLNGFFEMFEGTGSEDWQTITTVVQIDGRTLVEQTDKVRRRKGYEMSPA
nr:MAG TPA: minor tail protein [Caudoviricetes sp.]